MSVRSVEQHMEALRIGDRLRIDRAAVKRDIEKLSRRQAKARVAELVLRRSDLWDGAKVSYVLRFPKGCGHGFVNRACERAACKPSSRLGDLSGRQRLALAVVLSPDTVVDMAAAA